MKNKDKKNPMAFYIWLCFIMIIVFLLLVIALVYQYNVNKGMSISIGTGNVRLIIVGMFILIPILTVMLLNTSHPDMSDTTGITPKYFEVEFEKFGKKEKIQTKDEQAVANALSCDVEKEEESNTVVINLNNKNKEEAPKTIETINEEKRESEDYMGGVAIDTIDDNDEEEKAPENGSRFYQLTRIDEEMKDYVTPNFNNEMELKEMCDDFRNFSARELKLYYDIEDIRRFIGALAVTKLIILQGMSGTGKTSLALAFGEYLNNKTVVVPIQPMWKERTDLIGYYNEFTKKFNETDLLAKMYEANYNDDIYITVLDEMNIARVEYYFAEFLSLLELPILEDRNLVVVSSKWDNDPIKIDAEGKIRLPANMWFIGTANNDDSTFAISDKVYDRAMVLNLDKKAMPFEGEKTSRKKISLTRLNELYAKAQREYTISERNLRRISKLDAYMIKNFHLTFGNRIMKQIRAYVPVIVACGGTELQAIDDILSRKVFRKLESKNPVYVKQMAESVCNYLDELFGIDKLPLCKEAIRLIEQNV